MYIIRYNVRESCHTYGKESQSAEQTAWRYNNWIWQRSVEYSWYPNSKKVYQVDTHADI